MINVNNTAINVVTGLDRIKLRVEFFDSKEQNGLITALKSLLSDGMESMYLKDTYSNNSLFINGYYLGKMYLSIIGSCYSKRMFINKKKDIVSIFSVTVEFAGLKSYNDKKDNLMHQYLMKVISLFNFYNINFEVIGLDLFVDVDKPFENMFAFCNKKVGGVKYYKTLENQHNIGTHYIEKLNNTHKNVMKRAYLYDKSLKEKLLFPITRFELKIQTRFFNRNKMNVFFDRKMFYTNLLNRLMESYHILYFRSLVLKNQELASYALFEDTIRRRDFYKLSLNNYRIIPNISNVVDDLLNLLDYCNPYLHIKSFR
ncbi:hypothetical protein [Aliarcobacter cryaerophilus]|uniref:hypothetical protein n=1 Tax=Aliarcobacter cryaerophilus TaxID=28198 RepID=UPI0021B53536|nr:hypothetical protein [Aliarcobacter cryaerophilus]MCT7482408.1 hypothetical protein [Aliarcobacter cryaerophilus]